MDVVRVPGVAKLSERELRALAAAAATADVPLDCLAAVISRESGFDPRAKNPNGSASGLLQWTTEGARAINTTPSRIRSLSTRRQLELAGEFLAKAHGAAPARATGCGDVYLLNFCPAVVGEADDFVIGIRDDAIGDTSSPSPCLMREGGMGEMYAANSGLDTNGNGVLTLGDVRAAMGRYLEAHADKPRVTIPPAPEPSSSSGTAGLGKIGFALTGLWLLTRGRA